MLFWPGPFRLVQTLRLRRASAQTGKFSAAAPSAAESELDVGEGLALNSVVTAPSSILHESVSAALAGLGVAHVNEREVDFFLSFLFSCLICLAGSWWRVCHRH